MDYSPWSSKNLIDQNRLKKIMQVCVDVICTYNNFGGCGLVSFGDTTTLKNSQISLSDHGLHVYSPWSSKNLINQNRLKKIMQVCVDVTCMYNNFGGHGLPGFGDLVHFSFAFKTAKISLLTMDYSPWRSKNRIGLKNLCK